MPSVLFAILICLWSHTKSCKSYLVGKCSYFRLQMITFMLKVAIDDYFYSMGHFFCSCLSPLNFDEKIWFDYRSNTHYTYVIEHIWNHIKWVEMLKIRGWVTPPTNILRLETQ